MNTNYMISIANEGFYSDLYPREIPLEEKDLLTNQSLKEGFEKAQTHFLPYYLVAVVKLKLTSENLSQFRFHEGTSLYNHLKNGKKYPENIHAIHYFALSCFQFDAETLFRPTSIIDPSLKFKKMNVYFPNPAKKTNNLQNYDTVFINSLTPFPENHSVGYSQYMMAFMVEHGARAYFPDINDLDRDIEVTKWLWCAYKSPECPIKAIFNLLLRCNLLEVNDSIPNEIATSKKVDYIRKDPKTIYKFKSML